MSAQDRMLGEAALDQILQVITARGRKQRLVALLRHSARVDITGFTVEEAVAAPLTDVGRSLAQSFGRRLPTDRPLRIFHSEVARCVDTAERIVEGVRDAGGQAEIVGSRPYLAVAFIRDPYAVAVEFGRRGARGFVRDWLAGEMGEAVLDPPDRAGRDLLDALLGEWESQDEPEAPGLDLHISHDVNVMALLHLCVDIADPALPWPGYLEGVILETRGGPPWPWWYNDRSGKLRGAPP